MAKAARTSENTFDRSIVEGPIRSVVWKIAWPTMLQNVLGGLQGIVDHAMVGHFVGYTGNAAIGVAWQIFLVVIVFISSVFTGMGVLVARFAGARDPEKVNRTAYQAFLTAAVLSIVSLLKSSSFSWRISAICRSKINSRVLWLISLRLSRIVLTPGILSPRL